MTHSNHTKRTNKDDNTMKNKIFLSCLAFLSTSLIFSNVYAGKKWGYEGNVGPAYWGTLSSKYKLCSTGKEQSPINIGVLTKPAKAQLQFHYENIPLDLVLTRNNLYINTHGTPNEYLVFDGQPYYLQQMHFHTPSEHTLHGKHYPLEAHLVHKNTAGQLLVVGMFVKPGRKNSILEKMLSVPLPAEGREKSYKTIQINPRDLLPKHGRYYLYAGSLTTPPCSEGVTWIVMKTPIQASASQIKQFQSIEPFNARPVQPLNERTLYRAQTHQ